MTLNIAENKNFKANSCLVVTERDLKITPTQRRTFLSLEADPMRQRAYILFEGPDPGAISRSTGLTPSRVHVKGAPTRVGTGKYWKNNEWIMDSAADKSRATIEEHIVSIFEQLKPGWDAIVTVAKRCDEVQLAWVLEVNFGDRPHGPHFSREIIAKLAELRASVDCDWYLYTGEESPALN